MRRALGLAVALSLVAGCGVIQPARMALPPELQTGTEALRIEGMSGTRLGSFRVGPDAGRFTRSASRLSVFSDAAAVDRAAAGFTLAATGAHPDLKAECSAARASGQVAGVRFDAKPMAYTCQFAAGVSEGSLVLKESQSRMLLGGTPARAGEVRFGGVALGVQSSHQVKGSPLSLGTPGGYVFMLQGRAVAAVSLTDSTPVLHLPRDMEEPLRTAVLAGALAVALLWDPAP